MMRLNATFLECGGWTPLCHLRFPILYDLPGGGPPERKKRHGDVALQIYLLASHGGYSSYFIDIRGNFAIILWRSGAGSVIGTGRGILKREKMPEVSHVRGVRCEKKFRVVSSEGERLLDVQKVTGSSPVPPMSGEPAVYAGSFL